eukprot:860357-Ditylum_brightwellii.AAC.1
MQVLKKTYFKMYKKDLDIVPKGELSGYFERLMFYCLQTAEEEFNEEYHTRRRWGTDEGQVFKILVNSPPEYLKMVDAKYVEKYRYSLWRAIEKELRGYTEKATVFTFGMKIKPVETVAKLLESTMAGIGTDELGLSAAVVRYQQLLPEVTQAYKELWGGKTLEKRIKGETSGRYEKLLVETISVRE